MSLISKLEQVCLRFPERHALSEASRHLTYRELWQQIEQRATTLPPGVCLVQGPRGIDTVLDLLAAWKAPGAIPLPLDPQFPAARVEELKERLSGCKEEGLCYLIATSGSSGNPKIVRMSEAGVVPMLEAQIQAFGLTYETRTLWMLSPGFDASLSDIGTTLLAGATLVCAPCDVARRLPALLRSEQISYLDMPPHLLEVYQPSDFPSSLETLVVGGAPSRPERLREWARRFSLFVVYGPTEATVCSSLSQVDQQWREPHIGQPIAANRYRVVSNELQIAGPGLALGYLDPEATSSAFLEEGRQRWYRTGDQVKPSQGHHGLIFEGRRDRQVKLRGQRLELEEIERRLWPVFGADQVAVVKVNEQLAVFWEGPGCLETAQKTLTNSLPPSWQPGSWTGLMRLPRCPSGKIDRLRLGLPKPEMLDSLEAIRRCLELEKQGFDLGVPQLLARPTALATVPELSKIVQKLVSQIPHVQARPPGSCLLVTGASGRLGRSLLQRLSVDHSLVLLTRNSDITGFECLRGDVSLPQLGLSRAEFTALGKRLHGVLNLAGRLDLSCSVEELLGVNVRSLLNLSELGVPIHHASSLAVALACEPRPPALDPKSELPQTGVVFGGYAQSKWVADQLFDALPLRGWKFRYGQLLGYPQPDELLYQTIRGLTELGNRPVIEKSGFGFDFTPLQWASESTCRWLRRPAAGNRNLHLSCGLRVELHELFEALSLPSLAVEKFFAQTPPTAHSAMALRCLSRLDPNSEKLWRDFDLLLCSRHQSLGNISEPPGKSRQLVQDYIDSCLVSSAEGGGPGPENLAS